MSRLKGVPSLICCLRGRQSHDAKIPRHIKVDDYFSKEKKKKKKKAII